MHFAHNHAVSALIFDMDDLLVRSAAIWLAAENSLLRALGQTWTPELAAQYKGMNSLDVARVIHETYRPAWPLTESQRLLRDTLIAGFNGQVEPMPGAVEMVQRVAGRVPMAVASGSPLTAIEYCLNTLGLRQHFAQVISSEVVPLGKPHPDVFLAVATALNVPAGKCLVFEDSLIGVRAAAAAGMRCFSVPSGPHTEANRYFPSLAAIKLEDIFP
ncbi:MAG: Fructose-1-phosphate phosphatase YqaB [Verrucomicrobiae bacterium]|nr:Fructose-1-phosphate phosphatase YqaB [Verrucomicrobiae bacterium]